jgi:ribosomal protein S18 acetylase RimI-like enzyme
MDVLIRPALAAELDAVGALTVEVYRGDGEPLVSDPYLAVLADAASRAAAPRTEVVVAADAATGELAGALTYCRAGSPFADLAVDDEAEIRMLGIRSAARRRGIGEALVRDSLERARAHGCPRLVLSTMPSMRPAQRMYERLGFGRIPDRDLTLSNGYRLMAYALDLDP